jgi:hypothetical protein
LHHLAEKCWHQEPEMRLSDEGLLAALSAALKRLQPNEDAASLRIVDHKSMQPNMQRSGLEPEFQSCLMSPVGSLDRNMQPGEINTD